MAGLLLSRDWGLVITNGDKYSLTEVGARNTLDWRIHLTKDGSPASFWHDVPLYPNSGNSSVIDFVVEIPRWTDAKIEIKRDEPLNPIFHDGMANFTDFPGDNDPMDAFDIGNDIGYVGQIKQVKVLGALALNDGGETDWKVIVLDVNDPLAPFVESVEDLEEYRPGIAEAYRQWYLYYKVARGDGVLEIVGEEYQDASFAARTIEESHGFWRELVAGEVDSNEISYNQTSLAEFSNSFVETVSTYDAFDIPRESSIEAAAEKPDEYDHWYYLDDEYELIVLPGEEVGDDD
ncbi:hypothetical protein OHC33_003375 [Knufia fluminis]|uniref:inorganic diphosphatase n=1 Tax=Knufia fluminis TaxID=191047 RepID=A0AAN8EHE7_9EURO|nr:hypothetical protein OHC33_003375 [Knufia fluminis]